MDEAWVQSAPTYNQDKYPIDYIEPTLVGNSAIWTVEKGKVTPFFAVPAIGDHWQPSLISREPGKLIISYNSQHAYLTGTMSSTIPMPSSGLRPDVFLADDDIYVAEIAVT